MGPVPHTAAPPNGYPQPPQRPATPMRAASAPSFMPGAATSGKQMAVPRAPFTRPRHQRGATHNALASRCDAGKRTHPAMLSPHSKPRTWERDRFAARRWQGQELAREARSRGPSAPPRQPWVNPTYLRQEVGLLHITKAGAEGQAGRGAVDHRLQVHPPAHAWGTLGLSVLEGPRPRLFRLRDSRWGSLTALACLATPSAARVSEQPRARPDVFSPWPPAPAACIRQPCLPHTLTALPVCALRSLWRVADAAQRGVAHGRRHRRQVQSRRVLGQPAQMKWNSFQRIRMKRIRIRDGVWVGLPNTENDRARGVCVSHLHPFGHLGGAGAQLPGVSDVPQH